MERLDMAKKTYLDIHMFVVTGIVIFNTIVKVTLEKQYYILVVKMFLKVGGYEQSIEA